MGVFMRSAIFASSLASILVLGACQKGMTGDDTTADADNSLGQAAFTITSPDVTIPATTGNEVTYCYYFHTPNTTPIAVNKWVSDMTPGSHHMIFFTGGPAHADGLDMTNSCGLRGSGKNVAQRGYPTQTPPP